MTKLVFLAKIDRESKARDEFKMYIYDDNGDGKKGKISRKLGVWNLSPQYQFHKLLDEKPRSIILASGTLAPMKSFAAELNTSFEITLEGENEISNDQIFVSILARNAAGSHLNLSYNNNREVTSQLEFGDTVASVI